MKDAAESSSLLAHLNELRARLLRSAIVVVAVFGLLAPFAQYLFSLVAKPLLARLPEGTGMIATHVATPFLTPFKLAFVTAIFISMPFLLYQVWAFVAPALYKQERRLIAPMFASSVVLFYVGVAFAFYVVLPLVFRFMVAVVPEGVAMMTDISEYLGFVLTMFFAFGLAFEVPIATVLIVWAGFTTPGALSEKRPYVLLGCFVIGMFLTPPDVISQTLLAVPMYALYEVGIIMSRFFIRGWQEVDAQRAQMKRDSTK